MVDGTTTDLQMCSAGQKHHLFLLIGQRNIWRDSNRFWKNCPHRDSCSCVQVLHKAHIFHEYHELYSWRKIMSVEKFGLLIKNLNNLRSFIKVYVVFVPNLCGEKKAWRKNDKCEVYLVLHIMLLLRKLTQENVWRTEILTMWQL